MNSAHNRSVLFCSESLTFCVLCADREADGAGALGVAQHAQEAGVLSARSTGHRHREETCKKHFTLSNFKLACHNLVLLSQLHSTKSGSL